MNHTEHDHELIAGHATGLETDRAQAEALLASCPDCAADYREQLSVKGVLGSVPAARLTETEAAAMTGLVMSQLPAQVIAPVVDIGTVRVPKPLSPMWGRMTAVAAVLAGVVVVGTLITSGGGGSNAATTTGAFETRSAAGTSEALIATTAAGATTTAGATTAAAGDTTVAGDTAGEGESLDAVAAEAARLLSEVDEDSAQTTSAATATTLAFAETCPDLSQLTVLASAEVSLDDRPVVILIVERENGLDARAFYTDDCTEIDLAPRN